MVRTFSSLPAGFAAMPPIRFGLYPVAGCIPWTAGLTLAGYAVGDNWQRMANSFHGATLVIGVIVAATVLAAAILFMRRAPRNGPGSDTGARPDEIQPEVGEHGSRDSR